MIRTPGARGASAYTQVSDDYFAQGTDTAFSSRFGDDSDDEAWQQLIDELLRIRNLPDDWDGEGTAAPDVALVDGAIQWARDFRTEKVPAADRVIAGVNGTIFFEWYAPDCYDEVEVTSPVDAEWRRVWKGSKEAEVAPLSRR